MLPTWLVQPLKAETGCLPGFRLCGQGRVKGEGHSGLGNGLLQCLEGSEGL